jgi:hypothetical protein
MPKQSTYSGDWINQVATKLSAMPEVEPPARQYNKQEAVGLLKREILDLQKRGYSLEQISQALTGEGLDISTPTLKSYLAKSKVKKSAGSRSKLEPGVAVPMSPLPAGNEVAGGKKAISKTAARPDSVDL